VCGSYATIEPYQEDGVTRCRRAAQDDIARQLPAEGPGTRPPACAPLNGAKQRARRNRTMPL
jgi:hypothetical protein